MKVHPVFHVSLLKPYHPFTIPDRTHPPPLPIVIELESEYKVEEILDSKYRHKCLFYIIKWKGYNPCNNSWEPTSFVKNAPHLVKAFHVKCLHCPKPMISIAVVNSCPHLSSSMFLYSMFLLLFYLTVLLFFFFSFFSLETSFSIVRTRHGWCSIVLIGKSDYMDISCSLVVMSASLKPCVIYLSLVSLLSNLSIPNDTS